MSSFSDDLDAAQEEAIVEQLYAQNEKLHRDLERERARSEVIGQRVEAAIIDAVSGIVIPPVPKYKRTRQGEGKPEVIVPWIGDVQLGKVTPSYNSEIAEARIEVYAEKVLSLLELHRKSVPINKAHIWMMGDIVEGEDIFPGQQWLVDESLYQQAMNRGPRILATFVRKMLAAVDEVKVTAVIGNHGRIGKRGQFHPETNTDRMCYKVTETLLSDEITSGRLEWVHAEPGNEGTGGWWSVDKIGNYTCLLVHGNQFKGSLGVPWYGIRKKVLGWSVMGQNPDLEFPEFQDLAFGHWHQPVTWTINGIGVRGVGSPESANDYAAEQLAGMGRPSQRMMFVEPEAGHVTAEYPEIWLD